MKYKITRRDFLNGVAIGTGATLLAPTELFAQISSEAPLIIIHQPALGYEATTPVLLTPCTPSLGMV